MIKQTQRIIRYGEMDKAEFNEFFDAYLSLCSDLLNVSKEDLLKNYPKGVKCYNT